MACGAAGDVRRFESARAVELAGEPPRWFATPAERFGLAPQAPRAERGRAGPALAWDAPAGWTEQPPTGVCLANFRVAGDGRAECYLTLLAGDGGGLAANVNRWRAQMGLPAARAADFGGLPRAPLLGGEAALLELEGTWSGMSGEQRGEGYALLGLLLVEPGGSAFLKCFGPREVLAAEREAFLELARSFRADGRESDQGLAWRLPDGWERGLQRAEGVASFLAGPAQLDCSVVALQGQAGGERANVDRWLGQLGLEPLAAGALEVLPRIPLLGGEALLVEADAPGGQALLGAVLCRPDRSVFVKLTGARAELEAQRAAFLELCASLEER